MSDLARTVTVPQYIEIWPSNIKFIHVRLSGFVVDILWLSSALIYWAIPRQPNTSCAARPPHSPPLSLMAVQATLSLSLMVGHPTPPLSLMAVQATPPLSLMGE